MKERELSSNLSSSNVTLYLHIVKLHVMCMCEEYINVKEGH